MESLKNKNYWDGNKNKLIRYYFYMSKGLDLFNNFRYIFMAIVGLYYVLHLHQPVFMLLMFLTIIPILIVVGWVSVHHINIVIEWINIKFSTHYAKYSFELSERTVKAMEDIRNALVKDND